MNLPEGVISALLLGNKSVAGVMVSIAAFQAVDPGSIPGPRIFFNGALQLVTPKKILVIGHTNRILSDSSL